MATLDELENAENHDVTVRERVEAFFKGTDALRGFSGDVMVPVLKGQLDLKDEELALIGIYYRMYGWIQSLVSMNSRIHFQGAASAARSLFELLLDIKLLVQDPDGTVTARFHAYPQVERHRAAKQIVDFTDQHDDSTIDDEHQRRLVETVGKQEEIDELIVKHWGLTKKDKPKRPEHWSGLSVKARAMALGEEYEALYVESYPVLSWCVHAGSAIYSGIGESAIESSFGLSHALSQRCFLDATGEVARAMHIDKAFEGLSDVLEGLRLTPGRVILEEQAKRIDEAKAQARRDFGGIFVPK